MVGLATTDVVRTRKKMPRGESVNILTASDADLLDGTEDVLVYLVLYRLVCKSEEISFGCT